MKINILQKKANRRFNYTPRYYEGKDTGNIYDYSENRISKYRNTTNSIDFGSHWAQARKASRTRGNREFNGRVMLIAAVLILIFLYIIDFDLSIFSSQ